MQDNEWRQVLENAARDNLAQGCQLELVKNERDLLLMACRALADKEPAVYDESNPGMTCAYCRNYAPDMFTRDSGPIKHADSCTWILAKAIIAVVDALMKGGEKDGNRSPELVI